LTLLASLVTAGTAGCGGSKTESHRSSTSSDAQAATAGGVRIIRFDAPTLARLGVSVEAAGSSEGSGHRLTFPGNLDYALDRYAEVGTIVEGRVASVHVTAGDHVSKGQALATVAVPALVEAQAQLTIAEASAKAANAHAERESSLMERSLTTARENEVARGDADKGRAEVEAAKSRLALLGSAPGSTISQQGSSTNTKGHLTLTSPINGTVVRRDVVLGGRIQPAQTAFVVADLNALWATVNVFEGDLRHVCPETPPSSRWMPFLDAFFAVGWPSSSPRSELPPAPREPVSWWKIPTVC